MEGTQWCDCCVRVAVSRSLPYITRVCSSRELQREIKQAFVCVFVRCMYNN